MIITRVILKNWKNFLSADVDLTERNFIIGANATGKSNFLDVFRFMRDVAKDAGGLQFAVREREGVPKIRCVHARQDNEIRLEFHFAEADNENPLWIYALAFKNSGGGIQENEAQVTEEAAYDGLQQQWVFKRDIKNESRDRELLRFTHLEQITSNTAFRSIYNFFRDLQYLHIVPQLVRDSKSYMLASNKEDFFGRNLLERISKTRINVRDSYLRKIGDFLKIAVPNLEELKFIDKKESADGEPHFEARYKHWRPSGAKQSERQFSDGTLRIIGFMWALLDGNETILLEEPELYLNTEIVKQIPEFIHKFQKKKKGVRQVIVTTHSYDLLNTQSISPKEVIMLENNDKGGTSIKSAASNKKVIDQIKAGFTPAEAAYPLIAPKDVAESFAQLNLFD